jgi:hypothetical protein
VLRPLWERLAALQGTPPASSLRPIDLGEGGPSFLVDHIAAHWKDRGQIRVGQAFHTRPDIGLVVPGDVADEVVNPETQKILRICPLADEQATSNDLEAYMLEAQLVVRSHRRQRE